ncbi:hypothetical protein BD779DRAFT_1527113 [Infundibulicybe gibba]|nr:hypothetical protein BD779DRAFT_1527113 [Infundibulicybe gibba]
MVLRRFANVAYRLPPTIKQLIKSAHTTETDAIAVHGWVKSIRRQKNVSFAVVTDGSSSMGLQAVFPAGNELVRRLTNGASVKLIGRLAASPGRGQDKEFLVTGGEILGGCDPDAYPIQKQEMSPEHLRDHVHLRARTDSIAEMIRLRHRLTRSITSFFEVPTNLFSYTWRRRGIPARKGPNSPPRCDCDSTAAPPPPAEFFARPAFLSVSHQLHLESLATALSRVYTLSPCFRAEPSLTSRHLAEFWMLEAEWAFDHVRDAREVTGLVEGMLRSVHASAEPTAQLDRMFDGTTEWARMSYTDAIKELETHTGFTYAPKWGRALQSEHEKWLAETVVGGPVFVVDYPRELKPFYMRVNDDDRTVACFDLLVPHIGELAGGSVREEREDVLKVGEDYKWYHDLRKYGGAPHAGFGMGFERLNVRECIPMPRWAGRMLL